MAKKWLIYRRLDGTEVVHSLSRRQWRPIAAPADIMYRYHGSPVCVVREKRPAPVAFAPWDKRGAL